MLPGSYNSEKFTYMAFDISNRIAHVPLFYSLTLTLILQGRTFSILLFLRIYRIWWEIEQTLLLTSDRKLGICHRMAPLRMLYIITFTFVFKVTQFLEIIIYNIWKTVTISEKCSCATFIQVYISHRMAPLRMSYIVTLT